MTPPVPPAVLRRCVCDVCRTPLACQPFEYGAESPPTPHPWSIATPVKIRAAAPFTRATRAVPLLSATVTHGLPPAPLRNPRSGSALLGARGAGQLARQVLVEERERH